MAHLSQEYVQHLYDTYGDLKVLDDIIRHRAADDPPVPILGYPRHEHSVDNYELFTGIQLDRFVDATVKYFISQGFLPNGRRTVALLGPSNVTYIISLFALSRLGYTVLCLSLRITPEAIINLLVLTNCHTVVHGSLPHIKSSLQTVNSKYAVKLVVAPTRSDYDKPLLGDRFVREFDREEENKKIALIVHSSGSTGLPKPVMLSHKALLTHPTQGSGLHNFNTLPWYHIYGISTSLQAMWMRKTAHLYSTTLPLTTENLIVTMEAIRPEALHCVPYVLGLMAENERGLKAIKACQVVTASGERTPDELGDRLVKKGINLGIVFGTSEAGLAGDTMRRVKGDDSWNYIRLYANTRKYIHMAPLGDNLFEVVYLPGHPALSTTELSDDPLPGSWHSKDIVAPHPSIPDVWKYVTRIDDRVTLVNGEKVLPLPIEGRLRQDKLIREAAVVGVDRSVPGLLVFRAAEADSLSTEAYLDAIWSSVADANSSAEAFSQITRQMIRVLPSNTTYPQTDKGSIIRAQVYIKFDAEIKDLYAQSDSLTKEGLRLDLPALEDYIMTTFRDIVGVSLPTPEAHFFAAGVDSLQTIQMSQLIQNNIALNGTKLSANVIYEKANAKELARYLFALSKGEEVQQDDQDLLMEQMIAKYSKFKEHHYINGLIYKHGRTAILTGATGSIGAHVLAQILQSEEIEKVYCLVRGTDPLQRIFDSLAERQLQVIPAQKVKIVAIASELDQENFGLEESLLKQLKLEVSVVFHMAWPVNFNIPLRSFERHIAGLYQLLQFSLSINRPKPAQVFFCSSISTAFNTPTPASIPNAPIENFAHVSRTGYARSKFVGEHIVRNAARAGARSYVFRIGQIVGDTLKGVWNDKEFVPMMIRSALTLKALPILQDNCSWLPVDTLAQSMVEISETLEKSPRPNSAGVDDPPIFYNLVSPRLFSWEDVLDELHASGLEFEAIAFDGWLKMLRDSATRGDEVQNPAVKLIDYFETTYGGQKISKQKDLIFDSAAAQRDSAAMRSAPMVVENGLIRKFLVVWLQRWIRESYELQSRPQASSCQG